VRGHVHLLSSSARRFITARELQVGELPGTYAAEEWALRGAERYDTAYGHDGRISEASPAECSLSGVPPLVVGI